MTLTLTVGADTCLRGGSKPLLERLKKELTIDNPKYHDAKKYGRWMGKRLSPFLFFYEQAEDKAP